MTSPRLADDQLAELIDLIRGADSVELKLTVPEADQRSTVEALGMDPIDAQIRQVFFFDTPDLALNQAGVVVRARRVQRKGEDSVVKLRPVVPDELPAKLRRSPAFGVEVDAMPGGFVCSASLKRVLDAGEVKDAVAGGGRCASCSPRSSGLLRRARARQVGLDDLAVLGPIFVLKLKFSPRTSRASWSPRCGSTPTSRASSSSRPSACRPRRSRPRPRRARTSPSTASTSRASSRPRPGARSSSSAQAAAEVAPVTVTSSPYTRMPWITYTHRRRWRATTTVGAADRQQCPDRTESRADKADHPAVGITGISEKPPLSWIAPSRMSHQPRALRSVKMYL